MTHSSLLRTTILLTRPSDHAESWQQALEARGVVVVSYPTIEVCPPSSWQPFDAAVARLAEYEWLIFTSATTVRFAAPRLPRPLDLDVAAVGEQTAAALKAQNIPVAVVPTDARQEGLLDALAPRLRPGARLLFPQAEGGRDFLARALTGRGCVVDVVPASRTVAVSPLPPLPKFDAAIFASPSALKAFLAGHGAGPLVQRTVVVVGPTTGEAARTAGINFVAARAPTVEAVIDALIDPR